MHSSTSIAVEVHHFPTSLIDKALQKAKEYLNEPSAYQALLLSNDIEQLHPKGLVYVDKVLQLITADERPWKQYHERRAWLLSHLRMTLSHSERWISFERSQLKKSIHENAQKLLHRFPTPTNYQSDVVFLYNALKLWDETDLQFIVQKYFTDRSYAPLLVRHFARGAPEIQKRFAARVRKYKRYEFIETALLYQTNLLRQQELIFLFRRLLDDAYFGKLTSSPMFEFYEQDGRIVEQFKLQLLLHLHQRLREREPAVLAIYNDLRQFPRSGSNNPTEEQKKAYEEFLKSLWTGNFSGECQFRLIDFDDD
jgi:hypothetical protein